MARGCFITCSAKKARLMSRSEAKMRAFTWLPVALLALFIPTARSAARVCYIYYGDTTCISQTSSACVDYVVDGSCQGVSGTGVSSRYTCSGTTLTTTYYYASESCSGDSINPTATPGDGTCVPTSGSSYEASINCDPHSANPPPPPLPPTSPPLPSPPPPQPSPPPPLPPRHLRRGRHHRLGLRHRRHRPRSCRRRHLPRQPARRRR